MPVDAADLAVCDLHWAPCHRLVASRFPTVGLYDGISRPEDLDVVFAIEALTNPRLRQEMQALSLVPVADRVAGPGASLVMAAFTHLNPEGSRFSDGSYGVYYAADTLETAIAEVGHHRARFLARTAEPAIDIDLRWIKADLRASAHDIRASATPRATAAALAEVYHPDHYSASQALGRALRGSGSSTLAFDSVRHPGGQCVAVFVPRVLSRARAVGHLGLHWDGRTITHWFEKREPHALAALPGAGG
jgi:RES domain